MSKVAILTDTNSGIRPEQEKEFGVYVLPTPFYIDDTLYYEGVDLDEDMFYRMQAEGREIHTSMPIAGEVMDKWSRLLESYDEIVYIPLSSGLSSSCATAAVLAEEDDFEDRVFVVDNQRISVTMKLAALEAKHLADEGHSAAEIKSYLETHKAESVIYIKVDTLEYLKKGGRVTPAAAAIGSLLRIKPILQIRGDKLDAFKKVRAAKQARSIMLDSITEVMEKELHDPNGESCVIALAHTQNEDEAKLMREEILERFPNRQILIDPLSLVVACHTGPGSLGVTVSKSLVKV